MMADRTYTQAELDAAITAERQRAALVCDDEARIRTEAGNTHPEDSDSRGRCFAAARAAINCAKGVRYGENVIGWYSQAELDAAVAAERERWIRGRVQIPTETMEQEFTNQRRIGAAQERERCAALCLGIADVISASANGARKEAGMRAAESCAKAIQSHPGAVVRVA